MSGFPLYAILLASALITLDGTAVNVALPAIGRDLAVSFSTLQWISNAPLVMLAALVLPAGMLADRYGRTRVMRLGLAGFAAGSALAAVAASDVALIGGRLLQGASGALILPGALAVLRAAHADPDERTRKLGVWAAWTGVAAAIGPLLGGALVDWMSWRAVVALPGVCAVAAVLMLRPQGEADSSDEARPLPVGGTIALVSFFGALAYLLIEGSRAGWAAPHVLPALVLAPLAAIYLLRTPCRDRLLPPELLAARNCLSANGATFGLYFGVFGLSFLLALYTQQELGYSGISAGAGILPISLMLFLAEPFGRLAARYGTRAAISAGSTVAAAGIVWIATGEQPLAFWSRIIVGSTLFGLGVSLAVSALTNAAVSAVPESVAGAASGLNHATVRAAGVAAIALLGSLAASTDGSRMAADGFSRALWICAGIVGAAGVASGAFVRNDEPGGLRETA